MCSESSLKVKRIRAHYEKRVCPERESYDLLDWGSREGQEARFQVLCDVLRARLPADVGPEPCVKRPCRRRTPSGAAAHEQGIGARTGAERALLLDVGCGLTDLRSFLEERCLPVRYIGTDITWAVLAEARRRHACRAICQADVFAMSPFAPRTFDVAFCSGVFNLRLGNNFAFAVRALSRLGELAGNCVVANFLHIRNARKYPHCYYFDPEKLCAAVRPCFADIAVIDDYLDNDFTLVLRLS